MLAVSVVEETSVRYIMGLAHIIFNISNNFFGMYKLRKGLAAAEFMLDVDT